jgi:hypothetical protein
VRPEGRGVSAPTTACQMRKNALRLYAPSPSHTLARDRPARSLKCGYAYFPPTAAGGIINGKV